MFGLLGRYLKTFWKQMLLILVFTVGQAITQTALPKYFNLIVKNGVAEGNTSYIWRTGAIMLTMTVVLGICMAFAGYFSAYVTAKFTTSIRADIFHKTQKFSDLDYIKFSKETLLSRVTSDTTQMQLVVINMLRSALLVPFVAIFTFIRCVMLDAPLSLILGGSFILCIFIVRFGNRKSMPLFTSLQKKTDWASTLVNEKLTGARSIRAFNRQDYETERLTQANEDMRETAITANNTIVCLTPLVQVIMNLIIVLILVLGSVQMSAGIVELADLMTYIQYSSQLAGGFATIMMILNSLPKCEVAAARIREVLDYETEENDRIEPAKVENPKGEIRFENVQFGYSGASDLVLQDIDFTIPAGKTTAVVGATGSGKSTLLKLILQLFGTQFYGSIYIDGTDTRRMKTHDVRELVSYAPQKASLYSGTVADNLRVANPSASEADIKKACDMAYVTEFLQKKNADADFMLEQGGANLSGGQKQRVSLARAFIKDAPIYLLDDTFSALDFKTDLGVRTAMHEGLRGKTIVIVAQRISTIQSADKIVVMDKGRIVAEGTHEELLKSNRIYQEIYETQTSQDIREGANE